MLERPVRFCACILLIDRKGRTDAASEGMREDEHSGIAGANRPKIIEVNRRSIWAGI
jgi:hypothetical protein